MPDNLTRPPGPLKTGVVLAGGAGTRLGVLTARTPKPLLPVGERPFIATLLEDLARKGLERVILTVGYQAEPLMDYLRSARTALRLDIDFHVEDEPRGTGGALPDLDGRLDPIFAVLNGDTLFDVPLQDLATRLERSDRSAAIALLHTDDSRRFGCAHMEGELITSFGEKESDGPALISGGVYVLKRAVLRRLRGMSSLERELFPLLASERQLIGVRYDGFFVDIGTPASYQEAQTSVPAWERTHSPPPTQR